MAQRDQICGALGGLDGGDARHAENVSLAVRPSMMRRKVSGCMDTRPVRRHALCLVLVAHVYHVGMALRIEVGQFAHENFRLDRNEGNDRSQTGRVIIAP